jgi:transcriptional regulator GlxA family with amidase domain
VGLFLLATHIILDRRRFTTSWMRLIGMSPDHPWLPVVVDQVFHILTLAVVAQTLALIAS